MADDRRLTISSSARLSPEDVQQHAFSTARRGFEPTEVRAFLDAVARELAGLVERETELRQALADAERRAANPTVDEETLTAVLGQETTRVLRAARDAGADVVARAEEDAQRVRAQAQDEAHRTRASAEQHAAEHTAQAEAAAADLRRRAQEEATAQLEHARSEADTLLAGTRGECRAMVQEAQELRARVLTDLSKRRQRLHSQIEQLRAARERLAQTITGVRKVVDEVTDDLLHAEDEARLAAEEAGRHVAPLDDQDLLLEVGERTGEVEVVAVSRAHRGDQATDLAPGHRSEAEDAGLHAPLVPKVARDRPAGARARDREAPTSAATGLDEEGALAAQVAGEPEPEGPDLSVGPSELTKASPTAVQGSPPDTVPASYPQPTGDAGVGADVEPALGPSTPGSSMQESDASEAGRQQPSGAAKAEDSATAVDASGTAPAMAAGGRSKPSAQPAGAGRPPESDVDALFARLRAARRSDDAASQGDERPDDARSEPRTDQFAGSMEVRAPVPDVGGAGGTEPGGVGLDDDLEDDGSAVRLLRQGAKPRPRRRQVDRTPNVASGASVGQGSRDREGTAALGPQAGAGAGTGTGAALDGGGPTLGRDRQLDDGRSPAAAADRPARRDRDAVDTDEIAVDDVEAFEAAGTAVTSHVVDEEPGPASTLAQGDAALLSRRDDLIRPVVANLTRRLKRSLQDDQNDLLDRLRSSGSRQEVDGDTLPDEQEHLARYAGVARGHLIEAARVGMVLAGAETDMAAAELAGTAAADDLAVALVAPLRRRLEPSEDQAGEDSQLQVERVGAAFREWKGSRIEALAADHVVAALSRAVVAAVPPGRQLRWVADDDGGACADCDDNALGGAVVVGDEFPTGHCHPPVHPGCRCLLVPVSP